MSFELIPEDEFNVRGGLNKRARAKKFMDKYEKQKESDRKLRVTGSPVAGPNSKHTDALAKVPNNPPSLLIPKRKST